MRETERVSMSGGGAEREGDRGSIQSRLCTDSSEPNVDSSEPNVGLKLTNREIMTSAKVRCSTD